MPAAPEEVTILHEMVCLRTHEEGTSAPTYAGSTERAGTLTLSNRRIRFTSEFDEWDRPTDPVVLLDESLGSVKQLALRKAESGSNRPTHEGGVEDVLSLETRDQAFEFRFEGTEPKEWLDMITKAKASFLATALATPPTSQPSSLIRVRCSFCHAVYDDALGKCPSCGAHHV
jgi:hypothetical protein